MREPQDMPIVSRANDGTLVYRPLSSYLQVYRWPVSMVLSIGHRITGVVLSAGALLMTWWLVGASISEAAFETVQRFIGSSLGVALLLGWAAAMLLHLLLGIRHLVWDAGGFGAGLRTLLQHGALAEGRHARAAGRVAPAEQAGTRADRGHVGMHSMLLMHRRLPQLLVER